MIRKATNNDETAQTALVFAVLKDYGLVSDPRTTDTNQNISPAAVTSQ